MKASLAAAVGAGVATVSSASESDGNTSGAPAVKGELTRFATTAFGAEVTGPCVLGNGTLLFSLQHPDDSDRNAPAFRKGGIGYVRGYQFGAGDEGGGEGEDGDDGDDAFEELSIPTTREEQGRVRTAAGEYELLAREQAYIDGGAQRLGVPKTPDGVPVDQYVGSKYAAFGNDPDMNQFVATPEGEYDGYLYTNFEQSPGTLSRMPLSVGEDGALEPDLSNTTNLANHDALRELGGTRINCYGDLSPWGTPLSAEEEYSHTRVSLTATVSEMVEEGGVGRRGGAAFYNRPNPTEIEGLVEEYFGESWYVQGAFALSGLELLAYYLGADPVDQNDGTNDHTPIEGPYPNRYRYGYIVDFRNPAADDPADVAPTKYYVMGRGAWEAPDVQNDEKTAYLTSDGSNKGIYKFVADDPIPTYNDTGDIAGTLYAPLVTNAEEAKGNPPGSVDLELEWLELGHATNREIEAWISEYDDVDQVDYLETHAETDWRDDLEAALEEADRAVVERGNRDYITDEEILEWADQYEEDGPNGVDEDLRRVAFLEPRAAAKEIGATIEFRKAEGIDSAPDAAPGDYVYIGLSEVNDGLADEEGDLRFDRVDGGVVYRAELEDDYNLSTFEPIIVGPDATDPASVADDALLNVDNVYVLDDGRVLCCEDADQLGRSYPNDGLYVYTPEDCEDGDGDGDDDEDDDGDDEWDDDRDDEWDDDRDDERENGERGDDESASGEESEADEDDDDESEEDE